MLRYKNTLKTIMQLKEKQSSWQMPMSPASGQQRQEDCLEEQLSLVPDQTGLHSKTLFQNDRQIDRLTD